MNFTDISLPPVTQQVYIAMTWEDLRTVCMISGIFCMLIGYAINEAWHIHKAKKEGKL